MARKKSKPLDNGWVLFDVLYEDGTRRSNRRVPAAALNSLEGEAAARELIEAQDREIAEKSGRPPVPIKQLTRSPL
jgi:hypothetical protein